MPRTSSLITFILILIVVLTIIPNPALADSGNRAITAYYSVQRITISGPVGVESAITGYSKPSITSYKYAIEGDRLVLLDNPNKKDIISFIVYVFNSGMGESLGPYGRPQVIISTAPSDSAVCSPDVMAYDARSKGLYAEALVCDGLVLKVIIATNSGTFLVRLIAIEGVRASDLPGASEFPSIYARILLIALSILIVAEAIRQARSFRAERVLSPKLDSSAAEHDTL